MHPIIARLVEEHRNLEKLIFLLDSVPTNQNPPQLRDIFLLADVFSYVTSFPDVRHHPVEDGIVARLKTRGLLSVDIGHEIGRQHQVLTSQGADLMRDLESAAREETVSWYAVAVSARLYAERLRHNMAVEEIALFPVANNSFEETDWLEIALALSDAPTDPLFVAQTEKRFSELRSVIADEAGCGCFRVTDP